MDFISSRSFYLHNYLMRYVNLNYLFQAIVTYINCVIFYKNLEKSLLLSTDWSLTWHHNVSVSPARLKRYYTHIYNSIDVINVCITVKDQIYGGDNLHM